jgi:uncharacterized membrane protein
MSILQRYRAAVLIVVVVIALFVASPVIEQYVTAPKTEPLTELSVFGPYHNASYPYNLTSGDVYPLYFTVTNHLGYSGYYRLELKFRSQNQSGPNSFSHTASSLPALAKFTFTVENGKSLELPVEVSFNYDVDSLDGKAYLRSLVVNGSTIDTDNLPVDWNSKENAYLGNIFFELYLYNDSVGDFQYNQRYVSLWVNLS